jgi:hypothetical protein
MVHHYYVPVVHHKLVQHYQELSSGPPLQAVPHSYIWTRLAGVAPLTSDVHVAGAPLVSGDQNPQPLIVILVFKE